MCVCHVSGMCEWALCQNGWTSVCPDVFLCVEAGSSVNLWASACQDGLQSVQSVRTGFSLSVQSVRTYFSLSGWASVSSICQDRFQSVRMGFSLSGYASVRKGFSQSGWASVYSWSNIDSEALILILKYYICIRVL